MAVSVAQIRAYDRSFADPLRYSDALIQTYLDDCSSFIQLSRFGTSADLAQRLWTCHQLTSQADGSAGKSGPVTGQDVGDVKVTYATTNTIFLAPDYNLTTYGTNLLRLIRRFASLGKSVA